MMAYCRTETMMFYDEIVKEVGNTTVLSIV